MPRKAIYTPFGEALNLALAERRLNQGDLAASVGTSVPYVNQTMTGSANVSPQWTDLVAQALALDPRRTVELHQAAARTAGFKLDLTLPEEQKLTGFDILGPNEKKSL